MCGLNSKKPELLSSKGFLEEQFASKENAAVVIDLCISEELKKEPVVGEGSAYKIKKREFYRLVVNKLHNCLLNTITPYSLAIYSHKLKT